MNWLECEVWEKGIFIKWVTDPNILLNILENNKWKQLDVDIDFYTNLEDYNSAWLLSKTDEAIFDILTNNIQDNGCD